MHLRSHPAENGIALFWCGVYSGGDGGRLGEWFRKGSLTQTVTWGSQRFGLFQDSLNSVSRASKIPLTKAVFPPLWLHVALFRHNLLSRFLPWDITEASPLLWSHFSRVRLCVTPQTAAHQAPPSLGFSQEWVAISFSNVWKRKVKVKSLSRVRLFATPWTAAYQAPPSVGFSRQEYWSGVPLPSPAETLRKELIQSRTPKRFLPAPPSFGGHWIWVPRNHWWQFKQC